MPSLWNAIFKNSIVDGSRNSFHTAAYQDNATLFPCCLGETFFGMQIANLPREGLMEVHINFEASYEQLFSAQQLRSLHFLAISNLYSIL